MGALGCSSLAPGAIWLRGAELCPLATPLLLPAGPFAAAFTSPSEQRILWGQVFSPFSPFSAASSPPAALLVPPRLPCPAVSGSAPCPAAELPSASTGLGGEDGNRGIAATPRPLPTPRSVSAQRGVSARRALEVPPSQQTRPAPSRARCRAGLAARAG